MSLAQDIRHKLHDIRDTVRSSMEQCLANGSYRELTELAILAEGLEELLQENRGEGGRKRVDAAGLESQETESRSTRVRQERTVAKKDSTRSDYPFFLKDRDKLVKVAWSAKDNNEYEHRAPRSAIAALLEKIANTVGVGKLFQVDDILPVSDENGDGSLPTYQVYLVLAWLRDCDVIEKVGRDQYRLSNATEAERAAKKCWMDLPSK